MKDNTRSFHINKNKKISTILLVSVIMFSMFLMSCHNFSSIQSPTEEYATINTSPSITAQSTFEIPVEIWKKHWNGSGDWDRGDGLALDGDYIYMVGQAGGVLGNALITKYDLMGNLTWQRIFNQTSIISCPSLVRNVAIDNNNNVYVVGTVECSAGMTETLLVKYTYDGDYLWNSTWSMVIPPGGPNGWGVITDSNNYIYLTCQYYNLSRSGIDALLMKVLPNGTQLWNVTWFGESDYVYPRDLAIDGNYIYITGWMEFFPGPDRDAFLLKYDLNGQLLWNRTWGGSPLTDRGYDVTVDAFHNIYVTGSTNSFGVTSTEALILKYDGAGTLMWNTTFGGPLKDNHLYVPTSAIAVDNYEYVYITGMSELANDTGTNFDAFFAIFNPAGKQLWNTTWGSKYEINNELESGFGIVVDNINNVYITGTLFNASQDHYDAFLFKYFVKITPNAPVLEPILPNPDADGIIHLTWNDAPEATIYYIYRETSEITSVTGKTPLSTTTSNQYNDTITTNDIYHYAIIAGNILGNSSLSNCENVTVTIPPGTPNAPVLEPILPDPDEDGIINLNWNDVPEATTYYIYRDTSEIASITGKTPLNTTISNQYSDIITTNGIYFYVIVAGNSFGNSSLSNCEHVTVSIPSGGIPGFQLVWVIFPLIYFLGLLQVLIRSKIDLKSPKKFVQ